MQDQIEELTLADYTLSIDMPLPAEPMPPLDPDILPHLKTVYANISEVESLVPGRPISDVSIRGELTPAELAARIPVLAQSLVPLRVLRVTFQISESGLWEGYIFKLFSSISFARESLKELWIAFISSDKCGVQAFFENQDTAMQLQRVRLALAQFPNLECFALDKPLAIPISVME
ncbi:hypothetical protein FRC07_013920 [Ceratobasidium sp. 392]|nr:hypothetical protein FRC07_013920 [Ceratobasidium sp. 392]